MSTFPEYLVPQSVEIIESRPANINIARSGLAQRVYRGSHYYEFEITWPPLEERNHRRLMAFIAKQDGALESFEMVMPRTEALGTVAGTPVAKNAHAAGDTTLRTRGWYPRSRVMGEGDFFRLGQKIYRVTDRAITGINGEVTLDINPGLRKDVSDGEPLVVRGITFRVFFSQTAVRSRMTTDGVYITSATVREDWV